MQIEPRDLHMLSKHSVTELHPPFHDEYIENRWFYFIILINN